MVSRGEAVARVTFVLVLFSVVVALAVAFGLAACGDAVIDEPVARSWVTETDPETGVTLRCLVEHGVVVWCYER